MNPKVKIILLILGANFINPVQAGWRESFSSWFGWSSSKKEVTKPAQSQPDYPWVKGENAWLEQDAFFRGEKLNTFKCPREDRACKRGKWALWNTTSWLKQMLHLQKGSLIQDSILNEGEPVTVKTTRPDIKCIQCKPTLVFRDPLHPLIMGPGANGPDWRLACTVTMADTVTKPRSPYAALMALWHKDLQQRPSVFTSKSTPPLVADQKGSSEKIVPTYTQYLEPTSEQYAALRMYENQGRTSAIGYMKEHQEHFEDQRPFNERLFTSDRFENLKTQFVGPQNQARFMNEMNNF
jgi:hypothetical protein